MKKLVIASVLLVCLVFSSFAAISVGTVLDLPAIGWEFDNDISAQLMLNLQSDSEDVEGSITNIGVRCSYDFFKKGQAAVGVFGALQSISRSDDYEVEGESGSLVSLGLSVSAKVTEQVKLVSDFTVYQTSSQKDPDVDVNTFGLQDVALGVLYTF